jgi:hypothetical protein
MAVNLSAIRAGRPLSSWSFPVDISVSVRVDRMAIVRLEELGQFKNPVTSSWIEPATFRPVTCCLNKLRYRMHQKAISQSII